MKWITGAAIAAFIAFDVVLVGAVVWVAVHFIAKYW